MMGEQPLLHAKSTERHTQTHTHGHTHRHTQTHRHTERHTHTDTQAHTNTQTHTDTHTHTHTHTDTHTDTQTQRETAQRPRMQETVEPHTDLGRRTSILRSEPSRTELGNELKDSAPYSAHGTHKLRHPHLQQPRRDAQSLHPLQLAPRQ